MSKERHNTKKTLPSRQVIGQQGINLIEKIVLGMGQVWRPTDVHDTGVDGEIEIRQPQTGEVSNCIVKVQSKATEKPFTAETDTGFEYVCRQKDVDYWLGGNVPVVLIVSRPKSEEAYWIHVNEYFKDSQKRKALRVFFDKSTHRFNENCLEALATLAVLEDSGVYFPPPRREETLYTNLLEVEQYAPSIYVSETDIRKSKWFWARAKENDLKMPNEWVLRDKSILSFHDLREGDWARFCDRGTVEEFDTDEWALSDDGDKRRVFVEMLNRCLDTRLRRHGCSYSNKYNCYHIWATKNLKSKQFRYRSRKQRTSREMFGPYASKTTEGRIAYYRHSAFEGYFLRIENKWYLEINPTYVFTSDGYNKSKYAAERLSGIKRMELNDAVRGQVIMWYRFLTQKSTLFRSEYEMLRFQKLLLLKTDCSIKDDIWLARKGTDAEVELEHGGEMELFDL